MHKIVLRIVNGTYFCVEQSHASIILHFVFIDLHFG